MLKLALTKALIPALVICTTGGEVVAQSKTQKAASPEVLALGKAVFEGRTGGALCAACHGQDAKGVQNMGPDLTNGRWLHGDGSIAFLEKIITDGVAKPKESFSIMPPLGGAALTTEQVHAVAAHVRSLNRLPVVKEK